MDKGLIKIKELEKKIGELETKKLQSCAEIISIDEKIYDLEEQIIEIENETEDLESKKKSTIEAPKARKKAKRDQIISYLLSYIMISFIGSLVIGVGMGSIIYVLGCLGTTTFLSAIMAGILLPIEFKKIDKKYPMFDLSILQEQLTLNKERTEKLSNVDLKELEKKLQDKTEIRDSIEREIKKLEQEINSISSVRNEVIEKFCKDNLVLDKILDVAYDKYKAKEKVK